MVIHLLLFGWFPTSVSGSRRFLAPHEKCFNSDAVSRIPTKLGRNVGLINGHPSITFWLVPWFPAVTPLSDLILGVKGQKKGQIINFVRFQTLRCQIVRLGLPIKSVKSDPVVRPYPGVKGHMKGKIFNFVRFQCLRCQIVRLGLAVNSVIVTLMSDLILGVKSQKKCQIFNFVRF